MKFSLILPGLFAATVFGIFVFVEAGLGTEMTGILVPAIPWCAWLRPIDAHYRWSWGSIVLAWLINAALLLLFGLWIDYGLWLRRRRRLLGLSNE